ncbi:ribonuclease HII [bacterium]|nr:ribonuclease HII [bacterium]
MSSSAAKGRIPSGAPALAAEALLAAPAVFLAAPLATQAAALAGLAPAAREPWLLLLAADPRQGARALASRLRREEAKLAARERRWQALAAFDREAAAGSRLAGVDEVGRGPLAGPVTAAALILPPDYHAPGLDDSKRLSPAARERWSERLRADAVAWAIADEPAERIDARGIRAAVFAAMARALRALSPRAERVLIDGRELPPGARISRAIVDGDAKSLAVAGASVLAKVHRDALMREADREWPGYGFAEHKGYGSPAHIAALLELGPCPLHRRSFCGRWLPAAAGAGRSR